MSNYTVASDPVDSYGDDLEPDWPPQPISYDMPSWLKVRVPVSLPLILLLEFF